MKTTKFFASVILLLSIISTSYAQKMKVTSGKLSALANISDVNVEYDFSDFAVGKFDKEADYLKKRSAEMNEDEPGKGDNWLKTWESAKKDKYEKRFETLFSKYSDKTHLSDNDSDVKMIVKTTFIEPGFNVGVMRKPAKVNLVITFKEGEKELTSVSISGAPGNAAAGYDFDAFLRIQESYAKAGKELGQFLTKKVK